jgi:hypothetical protein
MILTLNPGTPQGGLIDYLLRLGCTVTPRDDGRLDVSVTYLDTVDDEEAALAEWCGSWAAAHVPRIRLATAAA